MTISITALDNSNDDDLGWNLHGSGNPSITIFGSAVQVWAVAQGRDVSVEEAALAFNVRPEIIVHAVDDHPWMSIGPDGVIEHEGE